MRLFDIDYEEAKDFIFAPMKWSMVKITQLILNLYFMVLKTLFMATLSIFKNVFTPLKTDEWLSQLVKSIRGIKK